ncbi:MAG: iron-containing alcohol dehydrogenase [Puniceicoccales bacterium]|jgi:alcohol dehydrogenase YqhD (iron-dependent ADH family)|nr:iron-containing alcohol dehydrogenase [Puniceicoccales bacterium]
MNTFNFCNPVRIHFGENSISKLTDELEKFGPNVLLTYGGGSIKRNGIYRAVLDSLKAARKNVFELSGIMANPRTEKVYEGIRMCRERAIDFILAVGGGSVIDCSKFIAAGAKLDGDFFETLLIKRAPIFEALPLGVVLTIAATGSEMNANCVITHWQKHLKLAYEHNLLYPKFSILDPIYTYSVSQSQMVFGCVDILSHIFEVYFSAPDTSNVSDDIAEALIKSVMENLAVALNNPKDYTARSNIMWASSMALNGLLGLGKEQDWMGHQIEHVLSAFYDVPHGAGLAVVHPVYLKYICQKVPKKFVRYAQRVWHLDCLGKTEEAIALESIEKTRAYFKSIGAPITLQEIEIPPEAIDKMAETVHPFPTSYAHLTQEDMKRILRQCLK